MSSQVDDFALSRSCLGWLNDDEWELLVGHLLAFCEAPAFRGARPGWVFKRDVWGLGYYMDGRPAEVSLLQLAATCHAVRRRTINKCVPLARQRLRAAAARPPETSDAIGRYLFETAYARLRHNHVSLGNMSRTLANEPFVYAAVNEWYDKVTPSIADGDQAVLHAETNNLTGDLGAFARANLIPAMQFARSARVPADSTTTYQDREETIQLLLPSDEDVTAVATRVTRALLLDRALSVAREQYMIQSCRIW